MPDKPIIFSAPMIRALLDGRKTQTRRVLNPQPEQNSAGLWVYPPSTTKTTKRNWRGFCQTDEDGLASFILSTPHAPYAPKERLWVRETWSGEHVFRMIPPASRPVGVDLGEGNAAFRENIWYWADGNPEFGDWERLRSPIHMPRWASRMTLGVTEVRVQRLQEISEADAVSEGMVPVWPDGIPIQHDGSGAVCREAFCHLWNTIHGPDAWDENPWVCALTFNVHRCNIDQMER